MTKRVLVVGGYGETGRHATAVLAADPRFSVTAAGRREDALARLRHDLDQRIAVAQVDFDDAPALQRLTAQHDVIVNMAGPMSNVLDKVALAALAGGRDYVDPGGSATLYNRLQPYRSEFVRQGRTAVVCAGWIAGLSELLPKGLLAQARRRYDHIDEFHAICGDNNLWSSTATRDVVEYLRRGDSLRQIGLLRRGMRVARNPLTMWRWFDLPQPVGRVRTMYRLTEEFVKVIEGGPYREVSSNFALMSLRSLLVFARVRDPKIPMERAVEMLDRARLADQGRFHLKSFVAAQVSGAVDGLPARDSRVVLCPDHNRATGAAAAVAAAQIAGGSAAAGVFYASEVMDAERFVADFVELGFPIVSEQQGARDSVLRVA